ncbi:Aspartyl protease family protein [Thalictrum thalictroides]|uniref:Aspartyl protease family protein n=1 Tax=Thalictrum thalictroides TaxID=46969 RepID=A0A7J6VLY8_THATH|nr:Aspartyl protease family protein [Thalictrum thalictroides]
MVFSVKTFISIYIFFVLLPSCFSSNHASIPTLSGFSAKIINRNSPQSPFYNPNLTRIDRIKTSFLRSHTNAASPNLVDTKLRYTDSEYVMEYYIGTPAIKTYGILDTGSSLTWLQCEPCQECYRQTRAPIFDPSKSSTFNHLSCKDIRCSRMIGTRRCEENGKCPYGIIYADASYSMGNLAQETLIFDNDDRNVTHPKVVIGCGNKNTKFDHALEGIPGIIGLNTDEASIITQLSYKDFSYCFGDFENPLKTGYAKFGDKSIIKGYKTPFQILDSRHHYHLTLEGITVDSFRLPIPKDAFTVKKNPFSIKGGFIIDSGCTGTFLNRTAHTILVDHLIQKFSTWKNLKRHPEVEHRSGFKLCYEFTWVTFKFIPVLTFHFTNADFQIPNYNSWVPVEGATYCFTIFPTDEQSILGNFQQQNFDIGYDLRNNIVSFSYNGNCKDGELRE